MKLQMFITVIISALIISCSGTKASADCKGPAKPDCLCTMQYDPVCGCDGKTYSNACVASCNGVKKWVKGECNGNGSTANE